jgi:ketosteroid isomerase-like protein
MALPDRSRLFEIVGSESWCKVLPRRKRRELTMRQFVLLFLFIATLPVLVMAQENTPSDPTALDEVKKEVLRVDAEQDAAVLKGDVETLNRIYANDIVNVSRGELLDKNQLLANFRNGTHKALVIRHKILSVHIYGDTAVLTGRSLTTLQHEGVVSNGPRLYNHVFVRRDGRWQLVLVHISDEKKP